MGAQLAAKDKPRSNDDQVMAALQGISHTVDLVVIENPLATAHGENKKRESIRSLRDDPLAGMHSRGQIDEAMFYAGRTWQMHHENSEIGGVSAIDTTKDAVDGGRIPEPISDRQIRAFKQLRLADEALGYQGKMLIRKVLGERKSVQEYSMGLGLTSEREFNYMSRRLRECLDTLAELWGFA
jgi:hypothetical protein